MGGLVALFCLMSCCSQLHGGGKVPLTFLDGDKDFDDSSQDCFSLMGQFSSEEF